MQFRLALFSFGSGGGLAIPDTDGDAFLLGPTLTRLSELAANGQRDAVVQHVAELEAFLRAEPIVASEPLQLWLLARQLDCYAVAIDHPVRQQKKTRQVNRAWKSIADKVNAFSAAVREVVILANGVSKEDLRMLANYSTETSRKGNLYSTVAMFLINEYEVHPNLLPSAGRWLATGERQVLAGFSEKLLRSQSSTPPAGEDVRVSPKLDPNHRRAGMGFIYKEEYRSAFELFFRAFRWGEDKCAHFVAYRAGCNNPENVVKSFLAIRPPAEDVGERDYYTFAHVYKIPSVGAKARVSTGFVLPLEGGTYLIGGQLLMEGDKKRHDVFNNVEVIALSNEDFEAPEPILNAMIMSSNYEDEQIVSKLALRATPIGHSKDFDRPLDNVAVEKLSADIEGDMATEKKKQKKHFVDYAASAQAERVLRITNNVSPRWHVAQDFRPIDKKVGNAPLSEPSVQLKLDEMFGSDREPKYHAKEIEKVFQFWEDIRFSALSRGIKRKK